MECQVAGYIIYAGIVMGICGLEQEMQELINMYDGYNFTIYRNSPKYKNSLSYNTIEVTGLGLIICKEFITKNNGQIYATSKINKGTTFVFTLPLNAPV